MTVINANHWSKRRKIKQQIRNRGSKISTSIDGSTKHEKDSIMNLRGNVQLSDSESLGAGATESTAGCLSDLLGLE